MNYFVYILKCADKSFYTGIAKNLQQRIKQHNGQIKGGATYTRTRQPVKLFYSEEFSTRSEALKREHQIKKLTHSQKANLLPTPATTSTSTTS